MPTERITPHGGKLVDLLVSPERAEGLKEESRDLPSWPLTARQLCDLECLLVGGFSPLAGFMGKADYEAVCKGMRLADGTLWPIPVCLDLPSEVASGLSNGSRLVLRDPEGVALAVMTVSETWEPDLSLEAEQVYGTRDREHPGVAQLLAKTNPVYAGGGLECIQVPEQLDFATLRLGPKYLRQILSDRGWEKVAVFQTRSPIHRAQLETIRRVIDDKDCTLVISCQIGMPDPGEHKHYALVRSLQAARIHLGETIGTEPDPDCEDASPKDRVLLNLLPLASRLAGPREALLSAIVQQNHGCGLFIAGPDLASPPDSAITSPRYEPFEARDLLQKHQEDLSIQVVPVERTVYLPADDRFTPEDRAPSGSAAWSLSRFDLIHMLSRGMDLPPWFTWPEVEQELKIIHPPRWEQGVTVFFTGLPSSGKSTVARGVRVRLLEQGGRPVTLLDGDIVRTHLSKKLGFSKEDRDINIRRIGFVASEITKNGGVAICAPIAPYDDHRQDVREMVSARGGYLLVHIATPLEVCEQRDRKGLYAKARAGILKEFTGISDPYEAPADADLALDTSALNPTECVDAVMDLLSQKGFFGE